MIPNWGGIFTSWFGFIVGVIGTSLLTFHFVPESRHSMFQAIHVYNGLTHHETINQNFKETFKNQANLFNLLSPSSNSQSISLSFNF